MAWPRSFEPLAWEHFPAVVALFLFAQVAGLVAVFAPAGIGVREGVLLIGLQPLVGPGPAIVITAAARLWQTALELLMAAVGWWALRRSARPRPTPAHCGPGPDPVAPGKPGKTQSEAVGIFDP